MSRRSLQLTDLPPAARERATRAVSRQLAQGTAPVPQPMVVAPRPLLTFYRAAACYADVVEVQAERQPKDEAAGRVRFFMDALDAYDWVLETIRADQNRLSEITDAVMERRARYASQP